MDHRKPRRKSGLFCTVLGGKAGPLIAAASITTMIAWSSLVLPGCGGASPRFKSESGKPPSARAERPAKKEPIGEDNETRSKEGGNTGAGTRNFKTEKNTAISNLDQARIMRQISRWMGVPYKLGGEDDNGIDCSGYTMLVYKNSIAKPLPRTSSEQFKLGSAIEYADLKFGDLVFFNTTGESASHVGIYLGDDLFAHASISLGVTISSLESSYYKKHYEGARRIVE